MGAKLIKANTKMGWRFDPWWTTHFGFQQIRTNIWSEAQENSSSSWYYTTKHVEQKSPR